MPPTVKLSIKRLGLITGLWSIFFLLYKASDFEPSPLPIICLGFLGLYALGELALIVLTIYTKE